MRHGGSVPQILQQEPLPKHLRASVRDDIVVGFDSENPSTAIPVAVIIVAVCIVAVFL